MKALFLLSLLVILYTYAGYPLAIALLARLHPRPWQRAPWPYAEANRATSRAANLSPPISILMAVHNGAAQLPAKLDHLLSLDPTLVREVIVVSDGSTDATARILQTAQHEADLVAQPQTQQAPGWPIHRTAVSGEQPGAPHLASEMWETTISASPAATEHPRLRTLILPQQAGKAAALNHAIAAAEGEFLLFVDIRPLVQPGALASLLANFADPHVGCVAGELQLLTGSHDATATAVSGLYWRYEQWIRNCEAAVDSPVGVYGGFYMVRRRLAVPAPPGTILDDMFQPLSIIRQGYRSVLDREALVVDTWPEKISGEFSRKVRTLAGNFQLIQLAPWLLTPKNRLAVQLISHKLLRLVVPYFFLLLLLSSAALSRPAAWPAYPLPGALHLAPEMWVSHPAALFFALVTAAQLAFWLLALLSLRFENIPIFGRLATPAGALLALNAAAVAGLYKFLFTRGPLWKIWSPTPILASPERIGEPGH